MRRFTIMGFTEAELGFVLAALFIAVAITAIHERDVSAAAAEELRDNVVNVDSLRAAAAAASDTVGELRDRETALRDSIAALEAKISTKVPQCWEKGETMTVIAELDVLGANRFRMNGATLNIDQVRDRLASFIARGDSLDCRYIVRARPTPGIDAVQQSDAVWRLRRYFDVNDRPR
ncbi:MAG TPA: hypothetical protein VK912_08655 [Longimicrobiales bacterium]|nr:hypothetical protein [Longimicrobiales bacterium]